MSDTTPQMKLDLSPSTASHQDVLTAAKGGGITFAGTMFAYAVRFSMGIALGRLLGAEHFGLYNLALTAARITAGFALLGLPSALVRYISLFVNQEDEEGVWGSLQVGIGYATALSLLFGIGLYVGADLIAERLFHEPRLTPLLRLASLMVPFLTLSNTVAAATRGFNRMQYTAIAQNISQPAIKLILVVVLAIAGLNAAKVLTAHLLAVVVVSIMLVYFLNNLFSLTRPLKKARRNAKKMLKFSLPLYLDYLIRTFQGNVQTILLGALDTVTTVGIFSAAGQVSVIGQLFHQSIVTASMPIISRLYGQGKREQMARFYQTMTKWTFTVNMPLFLIVLLFPQSILSIFGKDFVEGSLALAILAWGNLVQTSTGICGVIINMTGNTAFNLVNSLILSGLTLGLNIFLIPRWGIVGAATATITAVVIVNLLRLLEVFILFRILPYTVSFAKPVAAGLVTLIITWAIRQLFHTETSLIYAAINIVILFAVYVGMILILGLSQEDRLVLARMGQRASAMLSK